MLVEKVIVVADIAGGGVKTENSFGSNLPIPHCSFARFLVGAYRGPVA